MCAGLAPRVRARVPAEIGHDALALTIDTKIFLLGDADAGHEVYVLLGSGAAR